MRHRGTDLGRRSLALLLAYLLALQVMLAAWVAVVPAAAVAAGAQAGICTTQSDETVPPSGHLPAGCPCGPMCAAGGCSGGGTPATASATVLVFAPERRTALVWSAATSHPRRIASEPERARAPPALA
jgi:hypothetical protein